jgi:hypothetical protein
LALSIAPTKKVSPLWRNFHRRKGFDSSDRPQLHAPAAIAGFGSSPGLAGRSQKLPFSGIALSKQPVRTMAVKNCNKP